MQCVYTFLVFFFCFGKFPLKKIIQIPKTFFRFEGNLSIHGKRIINEVVVTHKVNTYIYIYCMFLEADWICTWV